VGEPTLRAATVDDDGAIRALFAACFPDSPKARADVMDWQYWANPFATPVSWVYEDAGEIVAHYAGMPVPITVGGEDATGAVGVDAATAPSHRGQGLFETLARAVYRDGGERGMPVTLCYPNANSLRGFVKAGGHPVGVLRTFVLPVDDTWVARRFHVPRVVASLLRSAAFGRTRRGDATRVDGGVPGGLDDLWGAVAARSPNGVRRDAAWWRWRYDSHPDRPYRLYEVRRGARLAGAAATVVREDFGGSFVYLLELLAVDRDAARTLVGAVADDHADVSGLATVGLAGSPVAVAARGGALRPLPRRLEPKPLNFGIADNTGTRPDLAVAPWSVAWGDLDHL
jgi:predicted N-acetyltransferase YhbS